jgi:hypothetical protein
VILLKLVLAVIAGGLSPILAVITTSIVCSSLSSAVSSIATPAQNYGVNAGLNSATIPSQGDGEFFCTTSLRNLASIQ